MRFEIKSGGLAAILMGIGALSGAVFMLGVLAGYDVGRESQSSAAQVATAYPVASPPAEETASQPTPVSAAPPSTVPAAPIAESSPNARQKPIAPVASAKPQVKPTQSAARASKAPPPSERIASEGPPPGELKSPASGVDDEANDNAESTDAEARATPSAPAHPAKVAGAARQQHKPYNIQIEAAMDRSGANELARRLEALGYQPHLIPGQLNGQTWYKVVIGPYPTQEAAAAAQREMREKYNSIYGAGASARAGQSNSTDANPPD